MKELQHVECGGELEITWVNVEKDGFIEVRFECLACGLIFSFIEGEDEE